MTLPPVLADARRRRVGLLGGSFNPAHAAHRELTRFALRHLDLDEIWWLVSPQNPLKKREGMAGLRARIAYARAAPQDRRVKITGIEAMLGTRFTAATLRALHRRFPRTRFVWLMGADNLAQIGSWHDWPGIFMTTPVAVFARPAYSQRALAGRAAVRFGRARIAAEHARALAMLRPPAWVFFPTRLMPLSATALRARGVSVPDREAE